MNNKKDIKNGLNKMTQKATWQRVGAITLGSFVSNLAVMGANRLVSGGNITKFGAGTLASGVVTIGSFALGYENAGYGSAATTAVQGLNFATSIVTGKNVSQLTKV